MFAPSHLPANRHEDLRGKWGVMHGPTHALMILWASGSQAETQLHVPDVSCKYPTVVSTTRACFRLHALSCYSTHLFFPFMSFSPLLRTFSYYFLLLLFFHYKAAADWRFLSDYFQAVNHDIWFLCALAQKIAPLCNQAHDNLTPGPMLRYKQRKPSSVQDILSES